MPHPFVLADAKRFISFGQENIGLVYGIEVDGHLIGALQMRDEFEYFLGVDHWGKGYATAAGRLALDILFTQTPQSQITSGYFHQNAVSGRVLEKLGFQKTRQQTVTTRHLPMALHQGMVLTRPMWAARQPA
jgi:RimJ/RimL family protein N-acetyltransferase